jgi:hypothetical protein
MYYLKKLFALTSLSMVILCLGPTMTLQKTIPSKPIQLSFLTILGAVDTVARDCSESVYR